MIDKEEKAKFPPGPWSDEPDRLEWRHKGVPCLIVRNDYGVLCGYAACPPGHPWHGKDIYDIPVECHGGPTFSGPCREHICHVPLAGESDHVWWVGFDCAHGGDLVPYEATFQRMVVRKTRGSIAYRDLAYVVEQCERIANQILAA